MIVMIRGIYELDFEQKNGYLSGLGFLDTLNNSLYLKIFDFLSVLLLQINQVQVIMRLFSRQNDKRLILSLGLTASLSSQIIWAISKFHDFGSSSETGYILPTFIYLTRTSMAICYASLITVFLILKSNDIIAHRNIWLITVLTLIVICGPVAFFVADVANAFVYELSDIFSVVTYVICVVIPWEWCNRYNMIMRMKEKEGVLGRRFFEDEFYHLDGLELFVEDSDPENDNNENQAGDSQNRGKREGRYVSLQKKVSRLDDPPTTLMNMWGKTTSAFVGIADAIIATGFAIPRSVSVPSASGSYNNNNDHRDPETIPLDDLTSGTYPAAIVGVEHQARTLDINTRNRRDIFVYSTKQVTINFSDDDENNDNHINYQNHNNHERLR
ncbi:pH-response regulator protein palH/rim21 [Yamadazyma tenuis]|nr:pH-response regulator protein palH/rim21 [Yamadazyma tenuis]